MCRQCCVESVHTRIMLSHGVEILRRKKIPRVEIPFVNIRFSTLRPSDVIWRQGSGSPLAQVMAWCLTAPSHYLNQWWLISSKVEWHSSKSKFISKIKYLRCHSNLPGANELTIKGLLMHIGACKLSLQCTRWWFDARLIVFYCRLGDQEYTSVNFMQGTIFFFQENAFQIWTLKFGAISRMPYCVNSCHCREYDC